MAARRAASSSGSRERITVFPFVWEEDTFSTENVRRIVSLICASHMEHAMPEILTVVRIIFVPSFKILFFKIKPLTEYAEITDSGKLHS